jgi:2',3'-cyclic-nucleotide 2'-phosphodiesterase (5'-nucleotidase family)
VSHSPDEHIDIDDNGACDGCGESVIVVLDIFAINDLHGKLCDSSSQPGVDEMTTYLKNAYQSEDHVLILSSGDMWQGSSESNLTKGSIVTEWMNELDFASMTLGNHEYDWGEDFIEKNAELAEFPFLAINVYDVDTDERAEYCSPSVLVERGGATIGIIGAIGDCHSSISGDHSGDVYFKVGNELTNLVKEEAERLREAGADFIIYSIHDGYNRSSSGVGQISDAKLSAYYDIMLSNGYVDVVFEGHTHSSYVLRDGKGVYHLQNGGDNAGISYAEAVINFANGNSKVHNARYIKPDEYKYLADDPIIVDLMKKYEDQVSEASRVLGMNSVKRNRDELRQLVSELYLNIGLDTFDKEYDVVLAGGFFSVRSPGYLAAGEVTFAQIQGLFPFENALVLCSIKGRDLINKFINTNNDNYFVSYSEYGNSVKGNIDLDGTYYIITDTYTSTYAPNRLTEIQRFAEGVFAQHLIADYIEAGNFEK